MLRDDGPPVSPETIANARATLPLEYGYRIVTERGRKVMLVRSPRAKPDYLHELADVALYVSLDEVREVKDILLIGGEKSCRLEPIVLRDHVKEQLAEDAAITDELRRRLDRSYGTTLVPSPRNHEHKALAIRVPKRSLQEITADDVTAIRQTFGPGLKDRVRDCAMAYLVADQDAERLGRRVFLELIDPELAAAAAAAPAPKPASNGMVDLTASLKATAMAASGNPFAGTPPPPAAAPPRAAPAPAAPVPAPAPAKVAMESVSADDNTEVYVRKPASAAPAAAPAPAPAAAPAKVPAIVAREPADSTPTYSDGPAVSRVVERTHETEEYEVFVSKPKAASAPLPVVQLPPMPQAPVSAAEPPAVAPPMGPSHDAGTVVEATVVAAAAPAKSLREVFADAGFEVMENVTVLGNTFEVAAHKAGGKRVLVKRVQNLDQTLHAELAHLTGELGADVTLVIAANVAAGARLASWGSRVVILSPDEAARLTL